jgi:predicted DNA-binding transcriptional regulator YafY
MATEKKRRRRRPRREGKIPRSETLPRQWKLLQLLPSRGPGKTAETLQQLLDHDGFPVNLRTVQRDLLVLKVVFPIDMLRGEDSRSPYRWRWQENACLELGGLTLGEALSLKLVEGTLKHLLPTDLVHSLKPRFALAERVLAELQPRNRAARWPNKVRAIPRTLESAPPKVDQDILRTVQEALLHDEQLEIVYQALADEAPGKRLVHPRALLHKGQVTYLVATRDDTDEPRLYAIHRTTAAFTTGRRVRPIPFDLDRYVVSEAHEPGDNAPITLEARISTNLAKILRETPLTADMTLKPDDTGFRIKAEVRDNLALRRWILGHGKAIEVLRPTSLRKAIAETVRAAAGQYR